MKSFGKDIAKKVCKAAESNPHKLVALFREFGADVVNVKVKGRQPLHYACAAGELNSVEILVKHNCNIDAPSDEGNFPPILAAVTRQHYRVVKFLLKCGAKTTFIPRNSSSKTEECIINYADDAKIKQIIQEAMDMNILKRQSLPARVVNIMNSEDIKKGTPTTPPPSSQLLQNGEILLSTLMANSESSLSDSNNQSSIPYSSTQKEIVSPHVSELVNINEDQLAITEILIGYGAFGAVQKGYLTLSKKDGSKECQLPVAVKTILSKNAASDALKEASKMMNISCSRVLRLFGVCNKGDKLRIVTELADGSLDDLLYNKKPAIDAYFGVKDVQQSHLPEPQVYRIALDVALGLNYLHCLKPKIVHRDLKPANILLFQNFTRAKLADFGLANVMDKSALKTFAGTLIYGAPEMLSKQPYGEQVDTYSFGHIIYEMLTTTRPYHDKNYSDSEFVQVVCNGEKPNTTGLPNHWVTLLNQCWELEPRKRPSMAEILVYLDDIKDFCL